MSASSSTYEDHRKKWDREEYEKLALERLSTENDASDDKDAKPVKRELLKARSYKVDLDSK